MQKSITKQCNLRHNARHAHYRNNRYLYNNSMRHNKYNSTTICHATRKTAIQQAQWNEITTINGSISAGSTCLFYYCCICTTRHRTVIINEIHTELHPDKCKQRQVSVSSQEEFGDKVGLFKPSRNKCWLRMLEINPHKHPKIFRTYVHQCFLLSWNVVLSIHKVKVNLHSMKNTLLSHRFVLSFPYVSSDNTHSDELLIIKICPYSYNIWVYHVRIFTPQLVNDIHEILCWDMEFRIQTPLVMGFLTCV